MRSLRVRLLLAATLTMAVFLLLVGFSLNQAFENSARQGQYERMQALVYALLGTVEPNDYGDLTLTSLKLPDARLERPQSGLAAALYSDGPALLWASPSFAEALNALSTLPMPAAGEWSFSDARGNFVLLFGLRYRAIEGAAPRSYTLQVIEDASAYRRQLGSYRRTLWGALLTAAVVLLLLQSAVLGWSLRPLRKLVRELGEVEEGSRESITGEYPEELEALTEGLNAMINAERTRQTRYRNALGDLAHSLKTPLAVLGGIAERPQAPESGAQLTEQLARMRLIVDHQLKRAATIGARTLAEPVLLRPLLEKTAGALAKVYAQQALCFDLDGVPADLTLRADPGDLYELVGNLLDNAAKYGRRRVRVQAKRLGPQKVEVAVEDDGPGFPEEAAGLLARGVRADTRQEGQGLGLAAVTDIVEAYGGSLELSQSAEGGGRVRIVISA